MNTTSERGRMKRKHGANEKKNRDLMNASKNKTNNRHLPNVYLTFNYSNKLKTQ